MRWRLFCCLLFIFTACSPVRSGSSSGVSAISSGGGNTSQRPTAKSVISVNYVSSGTAHQYIGMTKTVRVANAYCDYRPDIDGQPTFCNDRPYPTHDFTLLVWGQNWEYLNGGCLLVTGKIAMYDGKPQIVATSRSQVSECN